MKKRVWNVGSVLQGLACAIAARFIAAIRRFGNALDDVDDTPDGMPVKRGGAAGRIGHLDHREFPAIAGQWQAFERSAGYTGKPALLCAGLTVGRFAHR